MLVGSSPTTDDTRLLISDVTKERILERPGNGLLVIPGAVGPVVILGMIPVPVGIIWDGRSEGSNEENREESPGRRSDCVGFSDVGIGREPVAVGAVVSVVPKAVVIPTTMPDVGNSWEPSVDGVTVVGVGRGPVEGGISPVDPNGWEVDNGASEDPREEDGWMIDPGSPSVDEGIMNGLIIEVDLDEGSSPVGRVCVG